MTNNNKADTLFIPSKGQYPLRPMFVAKNLSKNTIIVSVEPGTVVDFIKEEEHSVVKERRFFDLQVGEYLCIIADVSFPEKISSGKYLGYEITASEEGEENKKKVERGSYQIYLHRYKIEEVRIVLVNEEDFESMENYLILCQHYATNNDEESGFREFVFSDDYYNPAFNQMYIQSAHLFNKGISFTKDSEKEDRPQLPQLEEGETFGEISFFFSY